MNRVALTVGPLVIHWYAVIILMGILVAYGVARMEVKRQKGNQDFLLDLLCYVIPVGIVGARIYYVVFNLAEYRNNLWDILKIWEGGLAIYGGVISGIIFLYFYTKKKGVSLVSTLDLLAPSLLIAQSIGRWGNFVNQEAYGMMTSLETLQKWLVPSFIIDGMRIDGVYYQPTFWYESLWCLMGFGLLMLMRYRGKEKKKGTLTLLYFVWYGLGRLVIEGMRMDSLYLGGIRVSQGVSLLLLIGGVLGLVWLYGRKGKMDSYE